MASILRVPQRAVPVFTRVGKLTKKQRTALIESFAADDPILSASALERRVAAALGPDLAAEVGEPFVGEIFALVAYSDSHGIARSGVAYAVAEAAELDLTEVQRANLHDLLDSVFTSRAVRGLGKALGIAQEHERLLHTARVFTDIRPVFDEIEADPEGVVISQRLRLEFFKSGRIDEIEIALTGDDVDKLRETLDRADKKAASLMRSLANASINIFDLEETDSEEV